MNSRQKTGRIQTRLCLAIVAVTLLAAFSICFADSGEQQLNAETPNEVIESKSATFEELIDEVSGLNAGDTLVLSRDYKATTPAGPILVTKAITIDLNGHKLDRGLAETNGLPNGHVIEVNISVGNEGEAPILIITDGKDGGMITGGKVNGSGNDMIYNDGGVYVHAGSGLTLSGGTISGNFALNCGGGVYVDGGIFSMLGGKITDNDSSFGGGVYVYADKIEPTESNDDEPSIGAFVLSNGEITGNRAGINGGGLEIQNGVAIINGGKITDNVSLTGNGGGVFVNGGAVFLLEGKISNNTAVSESGYGTGIGGGICIRYGALIQSGGEISENLATYGGGAGFLFDDSANDYSLNKLIMLFGGKITDNVANVEAGAIYNQMPGTNDSPSGIALAGSPVVKNNRAGEDGELWDLEGEITVMASETWALESDSEVWIHDSEHVTVDLEGVPEDKKIDVANSVLINIQCDDVSKRIIMDENGEIVADEKPCVIFDANGGSIDGESVVMLYTDNDYRFGNLPTPKKDGYVFQGWYTDKNGGTKITSDYEFEKGEPVTVYAQWTMDFNNILIPILAVICLVCVGLFALNRTRK